MSLLIVLVLVIASLGFVSWLNQFFKLRVVNKQFGAIEGLRGYLAFFVFIHHMAIWYGCLHRQPWQQPPSNLFNQFGSASISFFFMITGFLFSHKLVNQTQTNWSLFFKKRVYRLLPLYLLNVLLMGGLVAHFSGFERRVPLGVLLDQVFNLLTFCYLGDNLINDTALTIQFNAGVTWSLKYEWFFYFAIPVLSSLLQRQRITYGVLLCLVGCCLFFNNPIQPVLLLNFASGGLGALLIKRYPSVTFWKSHYAALLGIGLTGLNVLFFHSTTHVVAILLQTPLFLCIAYGNTLFGVLSLTYSQILGQLSYSVYLLHGFVLFGFNYLLLNKNWLGSLSFNQYLSLGVLFSFFVILLSFTTYVFIERRFIAIGGAQAAATQ